MNELYPLQKKATYNALQPGSVPNYNIWLHVSWLTLTLQKMK